MMPKSEVSKEQILRTAVRCFVRRGYMETRLQNIANEAGLSKGGVYFHFPTKEDLLLAILERYFLHVEAPLSPIEILPKNPDSLRLFVRAFFGAFSPPEENATLRFVLEIVRSERLSEHGNAAKKRFSDLLQRWERCCILLLPEEKSSRARVILAFLHGLLFQALAHEHGEFPLSMAEAEMWVLQLADFPEDHFPIHDLRVVDILENESLVVQGFLAPGHSSYTALLRKALSVRFKP